MIYLIIQIYDLRFKKIQNAEFRIMSLVRCSDDGSWGGGSLEE